MKQIDVSQQGQNVAGIPPVAAPLSERERAVIAALREIALRKIAFSEIEVIVHTMRIAQVTRSQKFRFNGRSQCGQGPGGVAHTGEGNVAADGLHRRFSPQGYFYRGRYGLLGEYISSEQEVRVTGGVNAVRRKHLVNDAYQLTASVALTGEDASCRGVAKPNQPFTLGSAGWRAFEFVGRYGELSTDEDAFPLFANVATSAQSGNAWTVGLNWYLNSNLKLAANYTQTRFDGGAAAGADREDEKSLFTRAQFSF